MPQGAGVRGASTHFIQLFKTFLSRNLDLYLKVRILEKQEKKL